MEEKKKNTKILLPILLVALLIAIVGGVTYAFFNYTRTGVANTLQVGRIAFNSTQNNTIRLENVFPTSSTNLNSSNSDTVTITITGDTTYSEGIEYKVTLEDVNNTINDKEVPISFNVTANNLGTKDTSYYTNRGGENAIYNLTETGQVEDGKYILVGYIPSGEEGVNGSIDITAFIDADRIAISDTVSRIEEGNFIYGETPGDWIAGRTVFTTSEWNSFNSGNPLSFKVRVEANEGIWVEEAKYLVMKNLYLANDSNWLNIYQNITSIEFSTSGEIPSNAITSFDATDITSSGPVTLYTVDDGLGNGTYKAIVVADDVIYAPENSQKIFRNMSKLVTFNSENFKVDKVTSMQQMFQNCSKLTNINTLLLWNTSNVTNMMAMFMGCISLTNLDGLQNFDTSNVNYIWGMYGLFSECSNLTNVNGLINWNTSNVVDMSWMFKNCSSLSNVNGLTNWNTSNVTNMEQMFIYCSNLSNIDGLTNWNVSNVTTMQHMFDGCSNLTSINLNGWNTSNVTNMAAMFDNCSNLTTISLNEWNTSGVTNMIDMFHNCSKLANLDLSSWDMSKVTIDKSMLEYVGFKTLAMPNNYTRIDNFMFNYNTNYNGETFTIPKSVTTVGNSHIFYNFGQDSTFKKFIVESGSTSLKTIDDILYSYDGTRLISIPRGKTFVNRTYEMPEGLTFMNELSFSRTKNIDTLILPNSYVIERYIKANNNSYGFVNSGNSLNLAIYAYTSIKRYEVKNDNTRYMSYEGCIYSKDGKELIAVPLHYTGVLNVKNGTTTIGQEAFWTDTDAIRLIDGITQINIPTSVTTIEANQLSTLNTLMSRSTNPVTITIDSGNSAYQISGNKIVAK